MRASPKPPKVYAEFVRRYPKLGQLGLSPPEDEKPPPIREVVRVPVDDEGRDPISTTS